MLVEESWAEIENDEAGKAELTLIAALFNPARKGVDCFGTSEPA